MKVFLSAASGMVPGRTTRASGEEALMSARAMETPSASAFADEDEGAALEDDLAPPPLGWRTRFTTGGLFDDA